MKCVFLERAFTLFTKTYSHLGQFSLDSEDADFRTGKILIFNEI
jgi:hypothetical protein